MTNLLHLDGAGAEDGVVVVKCGLPQHHVGAGEAVEQVDVLDVLFDVAALDVEGLDVRHGHADDVRFHLHHQGDEALFADVIGLDAGFLLGQGEDLVVRVAGDVVDGHVGVPQQVLDGVLEVFIKAALF